jgi:superfamily II DNA or RNA helicase
MADGGQRVCLVMPTGSGKTRTGAEVVRAGVAKGKRWLWLAHRTELVGQACAALHGQGLDVGAVAASSAWPANPSAPVQVASIQTLLAREHRPPADGIVWDECHHASEGAPEWASLIQAYHGVRMLGLTATPERADGAGLAPLFDRIVVGVSVRQLTAEEHLVPCEVVRPGTWLKAKRMKGNPLAKDPLDAYLEHARGQQGLLFALTVDEAEAYAERFTAAGYRSAAVSERTPRDKRAAILEAFRSGGVRVLCNVYIFTEGTDLTMAQCCILARGASTAGTYLQMVGRVLRPHAGKSKAMLLDLQGVSHVWGMPEDERVYKLEGRGISTTEVALCKVCKAILQGGAYPCAACGYSPEEEERERGTTEITQDPLVKYARMIAQGETQRKETLLRWLKAAKLQGHKATSVRYKWRAVYQEDLDMVTFRRACAEVGFDAH